MTPARAPPVRARETADVRITLDAPAGPLIVSVPGDVPVQDLLPELVEAVSADPSGLERWSIADAHGRALDPDLTLPANEVRDHDVLVMRPVPLFEAPRA